MSYILSTMIPKKVYDLNLSAEIIFIILRKYLYCIIKIQTDIFYRYGFFFLSSIENI